MKIEDAPDTAMPRCPHCKAGLDRIWIYKQGRGFVEQKQILMCPHCQAFLGYGTFAR